GRGDEAIVLAVAIGIVPGLDAPEFGTRGGIVAGEGIATRDEHLALALVAGEDGGTEGLARFFLRGAGTDVAPDFFAGLAIECEDVALILGIGIALVHALELEGMVALDDLDEKLAAIEHRAAGISPLGAEAAVDLHQILFPDFLAAEVKGREHAIAVI